MKDPHDKSTIDGFADLVTLIDEAEASAASGVPLDDLRQLLDHVRTKTQQAAPAPAGKKRGRKPAGDRAMTKAEKQKAYRDRQRAAKQQEQARLEAIGRGEPVTSALIDLTSSFADVYKQTRSKPGTQ